MKTRIPLALLCSIWALWLHAQETSTLVSGEIVHITFAKPYSLKFKEDPSFIVKSDVKDRRGNILIKEGIPVKVDRMEKKEEKGFMLEIKFSSTTAVDGTEIQLWGTHRVRNMPDKKKKPAFDNQYDIGDIKVTKNYKIAIE